MISPARTVRRSVTAGELDAHVGGFTNVGVGEGGGEEGR